MRLEYKCDFNSGKSLKMLAYSPNNSIFDIFKCALRVCNCFLVTPWRLPLTPTSMGLFGKGRRELHNDLSFVTWASIRLFYLSLSSTLQKMMELLDGLTRSVSFLANGNLILLLAMMTAG